MLKDLKKGKKFLSGLIIILPALIFGHGSSSPNNLLVVADSSPSLKTDSSPSSHHRVKSNTARPYSGKPRKRSTFTGDWKNARNCLAEKGITFDINLTQIEQGICQGGRKKDQAYGGRGNFTTNFELEKMIGWCKGFFTVEVEGDFGKTVNGPVGALMAVDSNQFYPMPGKDELNVPAVTYTQFFGNHFGFFLGKLDTTSGDMNAFAHGKGDIQFYNLAFNLNPVVFLTTPYSTLGAGIIILPRKDPTAGEITLSVLNSNGKANNAGFNTLSGHDLTYTFEARVKTDFFHKTGHQLIGATYSNKKFTSIDQSLRYILKNRHLDPKNGSWCFYYNFDQYLYEIQKGSRGFGLFGRFGMSDGNPNPIHYFYSIGLGGKGCFCSRPLDEWGIGYYYLSVGNIIFHDFFRNHHFLQDEQALEAFYNFFITPWMQLTPDIQIVRPAEKEVKVFKKDEWGLPYLESVKKIDTAIVLGIRLRMVF